MKEKEEVKEVVKEEVVAEKVKEELYIVKEFATQTEPSIVFGDKTISSHEALALLLNKISRLEKGLID